MKLTSIGLIYAISYFFWVLIGSLFLSHIFNDFSILLGSFLFQLLLIYLAPYFGLYFIKANKTQRNSDFVQKFKATAYQNGVKRVFIYQCDFLENGTYVLHLPFLTPRVIVGGQISRVLDDQELDGLILHTIKSISSKKMILKSLTVFCFFPFVTPATILLKSVAKNDYLKVLIFSFLLPVLELESFVLKFVEDNNFDKSIFRKLKNGNKNYFKKTPYIYFFEKLSTYPGQFKSLSSKLISISGNL